MNQYIANHVNSNYGVQPITTSSWSSYVSYQIISQRVPVIVGLYSGSSTSYWAKNHWVVTYGMRIRYDNNVRTETMYITNNGWGNNNVFIRLDTNYMDGAIGIYKK